MGNIWTWIIKTFVPWMDDGKDHDKAWTHATLTRYSDNACATYASHDTYELNTCMQAAEYESDSAQWVLDMDERMLTRHYYTYTDSCAADRELESSNQEFPLPAKDAESKCMGPDDNNQMYTITKPPKNADIKTYGANAACDADEVVFADNVMTEDCVEQDTEYRTYEWTGVGIEVYDYSGASECPDQDASILSFFPSGDKDVCLEYDCSGSTCYFMWGDSVGVSSDDDDESDD